MLWLPNMLTLARIVMVPLFVAAFFMPGPEGRWVAFTLFCLAGVTDAVDGMIARKLGAESAFGRMLDPIADKLIVAAALLMLSADGTLRGLSLMPALIILCREILVSGLREFLAGADVGLPVTKIAKWKTTVQFVAIAALIASPPMETMLPGITTVAIAALWAAMLLTLYTGFAYLQTGLIYARETKKRHETLA
jgi:cardiolipin synthase